MKNLKIIALFLICISLNSCFWGTFGGAIKVDNDTDEKIEVTVDGSEINNGNYYLNTAFINPKDSRYIPYGYYVYNPHVKVKYKGKTKIYKTSVNFFGQDIVHVNISDFIGISN